ncbi:hypothetical protein HYALB_00008039 [Hymenoscyphus albidus]|uniref:Arrestin C-terminal-like domain-containing protein n=1 Tax=Hymenoscyphus albidus TaxID=595503 RepID=A0A9N9LNT2_9HELO|nr:hypothetical protein HYALB_00008039 [Hymenoscyphus albidus]
MPSFNPLGNITGRTSATLFEIRLDNDILVLRGAADEASSQMLKGSVVLCLPAPLRVEDVHMRMTGHLRVGWNDARYTPTGISNNKVESKAEIFNHLWAPFYGGGGPGSSSKGGILQAGNYEWPFELVVPGGMAESIEGLSESHIIYRLKATVARGKLAYDLHTTKPVRIVRTLDPSALELAHSMTVENIWPNKVEYSLIIPQKAIVFGTFIPLEMTFTLLLKGLKIGTIKCELVETQEFTIPGANAYSEKYWKYVRSVDTWEFEVDEEQHYMDMLTEEGQDGYRLKEILPLPKQLKRCLQDVDIHGIKIRHKVKFNIALLNPDGHTSELRASLPVTIFISPMAPINCDGALVDQTPTTPGLTTTSMQRHAPPLYGDHVTDQLYADVDLSGFMTPAPQSGMNTPFYSQSRAGSHENLASLNGMTSMSDNGSHHHHPSHNSHHPHHPVGAVAPAALSSRLQNLNIASRSSSFLRRHTGSHSGATTPHHQHFHHNNDDGYFGNHGHSNLHSPTMPGYHGRDPHSSGHSAGQRSNPLSRRNSHEDLHHNGGPSRVTSGHHTPEHLDEFGDLTKVPSYQTAVKTPIRGMSYNENLPNYETVLSQPPSPDNRRFSGFSTPALQPVTSAPAGSAVPRTSIGFTPMRPPPAPVASKIDATEERRRSVLQNTENRQ